MQGIGSGKVIASTSEDRIFVFFSDHGATDLIAFPSSYLYADVLSLHSLTFIGFYLHPTVHVHKQSVQTDGYLH